MSTIRPQAARAALLLAGAAWSLFLYGRAPTDVFYTGDAGLKSLLIGQLARGELAPQLALQAPPWLASLWSQGFYPFGPPFVYDTPAAHTVSFPIYFAALCSPLYALAGLRGALLVPLFALWGVWLQVYRLCRLRAFTDWQTNAALATVILASPLTFYGALLWEHTLGVLLFSFGLEALCRRVGAERVAGWHMALLGALAGSAVTMRPESYVPLAFLALAMALAGAPARRNLPFFLGLGAVVSAVWMSNIALYGKPLGLHGTQVLEPSEQMSFAHHLLERASSMGRKLLFTTPATALALYAVVRLARDRFVALAGALLLSSLLAIPLVVPNDGIRQIGPRYLLLLIPLIALIAAHALPDARWYRVAFACTVLLGVRFDVVRASRELLRDYDQARIPALTWLQQAPQSVIVVERQETAHELASLFASKHVLRADDGPQLAALSDRLRAEGRPSFVLVRFARDPSKIADVLTTPAGRTVIARESRTIGAFAMRAMSVR
ncbi:MAG TPA: hypothetical protein VI299_26340 [Polyangiales bacterium]